MYIVQFTQQKIMTIFAQEVKPATRLEEIFVWRTQYEEGRNQHGIKMAEDYEL